MTALPKTFHVKSFGCQMNAYDGERMGELMAAQGLAPADADAAEARTRIVAAMEAAGSRILAV